jgi:molybdopterin-guanine dinucleotide biosynthesis protein A
VTSAGLLGAVLAGGASRRLGRDKSAERVGAERMIDRAAAALRPCCEEVIVVSSRPETPRGPWSVVPDLRPSSGPLAGIEAALHRAAEAGSRAVVVLAVDLPLVDAEAIGVLVAEHEDTGRAAAAERDGDPDFEPLCAVYPVESLAAVRELLDGGERSARALFERIGGTRVAVPAAELNVNDEGDLARATRSVSRGPAVR